MSLRLALTLFSRLFFFFLFRFCFLVIIRKVAVRPLSESAAGARRLTFLFFFVDQLQDLNKMSHETLIRSAFNQSPG